MRLSGTSSQSNIIMKHVPNMRRNLARYGYYEKEGVTYKTLKMIIAPI
jgi:hypothetical protein